MAIKRVWDGATGAGDGSTWTDAYTTFNACWTAVAATDIIWVASDHQESFSADQDFSWNNYNDVTPGVVYSVDRSDDSYTPATSYQFLQTGANAYIRWRPSTIMYGIWVENQDGKVQFSDANHSYYLKDCTFKTTTLTTNKNIMQVGFMARFVNCRFWNSDATYGVNFNVASAVTFRDCSFEGKFQDPIFGNPNEDGNYFIVEGCDFNSVTGTVDMIGTAQPRAQFSNNRIPSNVSFPATQSTGFQFRVFRTATEQDGASTAKAYQNHVYQMGGSVSPDVSIYRTAGWSDKTDGDTGTPLSYKITTATALIEPSLAVRLPDLKAHVGSTGSTTFTVEGVRDSYTAAPTLDEVWMEVYYLGTTNSVLWKLTGERSIFSSTGLTSSTEAWTGASGKTKFKLSETVTVNKVGNYAVRVYWGKHEASKYAWVCPLVEVT